MKKERVRYINMRFIGICNLSRISFGTRPPTGSFCLLTRGVLITVRPQQTHSPPTLTQSGKQCLLLRLQHFRQPGKAASHNQQRSTCAPAENVLNLLVRTGATQRVRRHEHSEAPYAGVDYDDHWDDHCRSIHASFSFPLRFHVQSYSLTARVSVALKGSTRRALKDA